MNNYSYVYVNPINWFATGRIIGFVLAPIVALFVLWVAAPLMLAYLVLAYLRG